MKQQYTKTSDQIIQQQHFTLLELLDRLLDKGVVVKGEVLLSVADINLIYLNLGLVLSSVKTVAMATQRGDPEHALSIPWPTALLSEHQEQPVTSVSNTDEPSMHTGHMESQRKSSSRGALKNILPALPSEIDYKPDNYAGSKTNIDENNIEKGLTKLVLTLIELLRQLMEMQAIRRIDAGQLNAEEVERLGNTLFLLNEKMEELKKTFGLADEDLNLDLGPLGELL
jgi:hypothetical protein